MTPEQLYKKIKRVIDYQTCNTVQGPTIKRGPLRSNIGEKADTPEFQNALTMLKKNGEVFAIHRDNYTEYTLVNDMHLENVQHKEAEKGSPNKNLIAQINELRQK